MDLPQFQEWLEISKSFSSDVIRDVYKFMNAFPGAEFEDYMKASFRIAEGVDVETVIKRYEKHLFSVGLTDDPDDVEIVRMGDVEDKMIRNLKEGLLKGSTTHIPLIDEAWTWRKSEFTLLTGYNNDGKSLFIRFLCLIKGLSDGWKTACFAPEDYPAESFFDELIHTASGYTTDKTMPGFIGENLFKKVMSQIKDYFIFVNIRPPKCTLQNVLNAFIPLIERDGVDICIIDPLIKITRPPEYVNADAAWAAYVTSVCTDFARRYNVCLILVLHQLTPKIMEGTGTYAKPDKYSIKSGGNLSDSSDNVLFLQRPQAPKDMIDTMVRFGSLKIKKQKLVGIPQEVMFRFSRKTNRYIDERTGEDLFNFDKVIEIPRMKFLFDSNTN